MHGFKLCLKFEQQTYLPNDKNDTSPRGKESGFVSRKFDVLIEKLFMPWVCTLFLDREQQISSIEAEESLQWMSSSDVKLSLFWLRSLHNPSICRKLEMHMESDIWLNQHLGSWKEAFSLHINSKSVYHLLNMGVGCWLQKKMTGGLCFDIACTCIS